MKLLPRDRWIVLAVALLSRLAVVAWAGSDIGPTADGTYYELVARRIAQGYGYTWQWPDGVVTYAAHYPIGYPALVGGVYRVLGIMPLVGMFVNVAIGVLGVLAAHDLLQEAMPARRRLVMAGAIVVALHPALLLYTPAFMTEGVTASLLLLAASYAARARRGDGRAVLVGLGLVMGLLTLVRPQSLAMAPIFGILAAPKPWLHATTKWLRDATTGAAVVTALTLAVCAPWTYRNCKRMEQCALVSVNGGWNLAIGTQTTDGGWAPIDVPPACREVFQEAAKDKCFGTEAEKMILASPGPWIARMPKKLRATFDYFGAAPWYLHQSNPVHFPYRAKVAAGALETLVSRLLLAAALVAVIKLPGPRRRARLVICGLGLVACILVPGTIGYLACAIGIALLGVSALRDLPTVVPSTAMVIALTAAIHAVFFGAGRYGLVVLPFVTLLAFTRTGTATRPPPEAT